MLHSNNNHQQCNKFTDTVINCYIDNITVKSYLIRVDLYYYHNPLE